MKKSFIPQSCSCPICGANGTVTVILRFQRFAAGITAECSACGAATKNVIPTGPAEKYHEVLRDKWVSMEQQVAEKLMR